MTGLHTLLEDAAASPSTMDMAGDVASDLRRGHRALRRWRTRVAGGLAGGLAVLGVAAVPVVRQLQPSSTVLEPVAQPAGPVHTDAFDAPAPPDGWSVAASGPAYLTLVRDGAPDPHPELFNHKIAIAATREHAGHGTTLRYDGRTFYDNERNEGYPILAVQLDDGTWLTLQYPSASGVRKSQMIDYLDSVTLGPGACPVGAPGC